MADEKKIEETKGPVIEERTPKPKKVKTIDGSDYTKDEKGSTSLRLKKALPNPKGLKKAE